MEDVEKTHDVFNLENTPKEVSKDSEVISTDLNTSFDRERKYWLEIILGMAKRMGDISKMSDLFVDLHSQRQIALEHSHYLQSLLIKLNKDYKKKMGKKWDDVSMNYDRKLKMGEMNIAVEASLADPKEKLESIQAQINYMAETIKNIDHMLYSVKNRISIEEFKR